MAPANLINNYTKIIGYSRLFNYCIKPSLYMHMTFKNAQGLITYHAMKNYG